MSKRIISNNNSLYQGINSSNFKNVTSNTIFSFGNFSITSNFDDVADLKDGSELSMGLSPITLEDIGTTVSQSELLHTISNNAELNLDFSDLSTFVRFGSAYEFLRTSIENIILTYPSSLSISSVYDNTINNFMTIGTTGESTFDIPVSVINNNFNLPFNEENFIITNYEVWNPLTNTIHKILEFIGSTPTRDFISLKVDGNFLISGSTSNIKFHIKPTDKTFKFYKKSLNKYQSYLLSNKTDAGYNFVIKMPKMLDNGDIIYINTNFLWNTTDGYNIDINTSQYRRFLQGLLNVGELFDKIKTDVIYRSLTPSSLKLYDSTDDSKISKLLRIFGSEFDKNRQYIDSLVYIDRVTYDKINNTPDQLVSLLAEQNGWEYHSIVNEENTYDGTFDEDGFLPFEIDIEFWRRIIINSNYFWKSKGTRESIKSILLMLGIPIEFININEYVYVINDKINVLNTKFSVMDFPTSEYPYTNDGYPKFPQESENFYFQKAGDKDNGQEYLNLFRSAGFSLSKTIDNKKSWVDTNLIRSHSSTQNYVTKSSKLVVNTKEIDVVLDSAQGVEYDVFYNKNKTSISAYLDKALKSKTVNLKFEEFINIVITEMINARDNKILSSYQQLLNLYIKYSKEIDSNAYTFDDLYVFLCKYDIYLNKFIDTLLPATTIKRNVGVVVKNTNFTRQKFTYKRGVYYRHNEFSINSDNEYIFNDKIVHLSNEQLPILDTINDNRYIGNDGCLYKRIIIQ